MATYAIGDIHGCWDALSTLLDNVPISGEDTVITLGDYVDRGPESARVLDWLLDQVVEDKVIALRGNHEVMMQAAIEGRMNVDHWLGCGGKEALASYVSPAERGRTLTIDVIPPMHHLFIRNRLRPYYETDTHIFVHACVFHGYALEEQDEHTLYWEGFDDIGPHQSGKIVICGHTAQRRGIPVNRGHAVCIDTWVYGDGWLTCLEVESGQFWQANQRKQLRIDWLNQPS